MVTSASVPTVTRHDRQEHHRARQRPTPTFS